jgi:hypothetical protein
MRAGTRAGAGAGAEPTSPAMCRTIEIPRTTPEVREGHGFYPAIPVIFSADRTIEPYRHAEAGTGVSSQRRLSSSWLAIC